MPYDSNERHITFDKSCELILDKVYTKNFWEINIGNIVNAKAKTNKIDSLLISTIKKHGMNMNSTKIYYCEVYGVIRSKNPSLFKVYDIKCHELKKYDKKIFAIRKNDHFDCKLNYYMFFDFGKNDELSNIFIGLFRIEINGFVTLEPIALNNAQINDKDKDLLRPVIKFDFPNITVYQLNIPDISENNVVAKLGDIFSHINTFKDFLYEGKFYLIPTLKYGYKKHEMNKIQIVVDVGECFNFIIMHREDYVSDRLMDQLLVKLMFLIENSSKDFLDKIAYDKKYKVKNDNFIDDSFSKILKNVYLKD